MPAFWRRLSTQVFLTQLVVLLICGGMAFGLAGWFLQRRVDSEFEQRALAVATSLADLPVVRHGILNGDPNHELQHMAEAVRARTHVAYVVIANRSGIRLSHPNSSLIGKHVSTPFGPVLAGHDWTGVQTGTLGRSARGKAPIFGAGGRVIGEVSVGILETRVSDTMHHVLAMLGLYVGLAVLLGVGASWLLSRRMKRRTFGLEVEEIADLLQEREAILHGVREGVMATDMTGKVRLINDEARTLLNIHGDASGRPARDLLPAGRLLDVIVGQTGGEDAVVIDGERILVLNRKPVRLADRELGAVVTMRDRTETEELLRQVETAATLTATLRSQNHEFSNRLHTLLGLLELERYDEAVDFLVGLAGQHAGLVDQVTSRIRDPVLAALLIAKVSVAGEKGVGLRLHPDSVVSGRIIAPVDAVTVVGNLVDNAVDAARSRQGGPDDARWVLVDLRQRGSTLAVTVRDSGPGVPTDLRAVIFTDGFSTKSASPTHRGVGLALVSQVVIRRGGVLQVADGPYGEFHASLPGVLAPDPVSGG